MGARTEIGWTHHTFNAWEGCTKVSAGCAHCYAEGIDKRFRGGGHWGPGQPRRLTSEANWRQPMAWDRAAAKAGERHRVFCLSMGDVFDEEAPPGALERLWRLIRLTPNLDWLLLTKRPQRILGSLPDEWGPHGWPNVWLGTSVEHQAAADARIPRLVEVPARVHFLSCEPLLGPVDLEDTPAGAVLSPCEGCWDTGEEPDGGRCHQCMGIRRLSWVIAGGESGPHHRPMDPEWVRSLRDQCVQSDTPFFFKQWGGRFPKSGGRSLDGRTWDEFPKPAAGPTSLTDADWAAYGDRLRTALKGG